MVAALGPACNRIRKTIKQLGPLAADRTGKSVQPLFPADDDLCSDGDDCISIIQSWMGGRPSSDNSRAIRFNDVDRELRLAPGSTKKFIKTAAAAWNYVVEREGKETILFRKEFGDASFY